MPIFADPLSFEILKIDPFQIAKNTGSLEDLFIHYYENPIFEKINILC